MNATAKTPRRRRRHQYIRRNGRRRRIYVCEGCGRDTTCGPLCPDCGGEAIYETIALPGRRNTLAPAATDW